MKKLRVRPSKEISFLTMIAGIGAVGFGLYMTSILGAFGIVFILAALAVTGYHAFNVFSDRGVASEEVDIEESGGDLISQIDVVNRLQQLESLRQSELITEVEFQSKRADILKRL